MDLTGAVNMLLSGDEDDDDQDEQDKQEQGMTSRDGGDDDNQGEDSDDDDDDKAVRPVVVESDKDDPEEEEEEELAVDILASVRLGSGARITCLAAWCSGLENKDEPHQRQEEAQQEGATKDNDDDHDDKTLSKAEDQNKRKRPQDDRVQVEELDGEALAKARKLVSKAKIIDKERKEKRNNHKKTRKKRKQQYQTLVRAPKQSVGQLVAGLLRVQPDRRWSGFVPLSAFRKACGVFLPRLPFVP